MGSNTFLKKYYAISYTNTRYERYEYTGKIVLPEQDLAILTTMNLRTPYLFSIRFGQYQTCVGVMEFTAEPGYVYMPNWIFQKLCISGDCEVLIQNITIPTASSITFKPNTYQLEHCLQNAGALAHILKDYSVAMKNDYFKINFNNRNYILQIVDVKPSNICCIAEGDVSYEYIPADDTPKTPQTPASNSPTLPTFGLGAENEEDDEEEEKKEETRSKRPISRFAKSSFSWNDQGPGHRLDNQPSKNRSQNSSGFYTTISNNHNQSSSLNKRSVGIFEQAQKKSNFEGVGHKLGH